MRLGLFSRVSAPSYYYHPVHFLVLGTTSRGLPLYGSVPSGIAVTNVVRCLVLRGNSRHSHACSATDTSSIRIVSGRPLGRVTSGLVIGLVGTLIEPASFRFVAQHLNHCATAVTQLHIRQL